MLTSEELLAGADLTYEIEIPAHVLQPDPDKALPDKPLVVRLRPLNVRDLQLITRAAREKDNLTATLMVKQALVEPELGVTQIGAMHVGLVQYLLEQVNRISGITTTADELSRQAEAPLARAAHILAREYGWTPSQVNELTLGQVLLHLQMLHEGAT
ncbi:hypothetical protein SCOR_07705 [Sulfidibacter corallicola]|uniref:Uncharacterized protein n=1 Tax=Sulfidibacter corallicola TaxID=2818388 RepID=A0A8A4TQI8_SULCO|nr:hypothetical protein [Sulfidibacter corallicola]QTD51352.1 hypothetical protein J3U87_02690 [Sulfidibacter corallicola]